MILMMIKRVILASLLILLTLSCPAYAGRHRAEGVQRDHSGHIQRSYKVKRQFMWQTGYPHGRKGYVIDHIVPLKRGGADSTSNMQWQTREEARAKDKWE